MFNIQLCWLKSEDVGGQLSQFTSLSLRGGHTPHQGLPFELLNQPGEPVAFGIDIGIVDLIKITTEHNLGAFTHPRDDRFHFQGRQVLRLIHYQELIGNWSPADGFDRFNLQQTRALQVSQGIAWFPVLLFLHLLRVLSRGRTGNEVDVVDNRLHRGAEFLLKRARHEANVFA